MCVKQLEIWFFIKWFWIFKSGFLDDCKKMDNCLKPIL